MSTNGNLSTSTLPTEILQEIFFCCLPTPSKPNENTVFMRRETLASPKNAPLLLCHICKGWRDIALSSPNLWTAMSVIVRLGVAVPAPDLVSMWLSRSGALPLDLALYQQNESIANCDAAVRILDVFVQYTSQWGKVRLELFSDHLPGEAEDGFFDVFHHVPRLRSLHVSRIPHLDPFGRSTIPVPWCQLVHLSLDYVPAVGTALRILDMCPNLESCSMKIDAARGPLPYHLPQLSKLLSLSINLGFESLDCVFDHLLLPRLVDLTVVVRGPLEQYRWAQDHFDNLLTRSDCRIRRLEIHDTGMTSSEFVSCIQHPRLQALTELVIDDTKGWTLDPFLTGAALNLLTIHTVHHPDSPPTHGPSSSDDTSQQIVCLLPLLERLTIRGNCFLSSDGTIAEMAKSRWKYRGKEVARLQFMEVELPTDHMEDMRRLKELQGEGLDVVLSQQY